MAHRAVLCAALAEGRSHITNLEFSKDISATLGAAAQLCARVRTGADDAVVEGLGHFVPLAAPVDCCESGSTLRFLIPIASLTGQAVSFTGRGRLMERPQSVYDALYREQDLRFEQNAAGLTVEGALTPGEYRLAGNVSSQFISGLLFALPLLSGSSTLHLIPPVESRSYIDMTRSVQAAFGVQSHWLDENTLAIPGGQHYHPCDYTVEGDYSQAAFPAVLGAVCGGVTITGLAPETLQGDAAILDILRRCGAKFTQTEAGIPFEKAPLHGVDIDLADCTGHLPLPGETVIGGTFFMNPGGKGANQAVTVARLGGRVSFICKTGSDIFGHQANQLFNEEGIDTSYVFSDTKNPSGVALITVDTDAENCIVVAPGANAHLTPNDLKRSAEAVEAADIILLQLEIPMQTVEAAAAMAYRLGKKVVLNPAPASKLSAGLLETLYAITPNETEAEAISGIRITDERTAEEAARKIASMGVCNVIITLGAKGALVFDGEHCEVVPAYKIQAVDTTAAGDVFNGALVVALSEGRTLPEAVRFACKASAISVTRPGAQNSVPYRTEVDVFNL